MVDLLRWGMEVDYPTAVQSTGGRYYYRDDWETPDTQVINFDCKKSMMWEGHSCNSYALEGCPVGAIFYGDKTNLFIDGGNSYKIMDLKNKIIKEVNSKNTVNPLNRMNPGEQLDAIHIQNFFNGITKGEKLNSDIVSGHKSTLLVQLGNIAQRSASRLETSLENGHIQDRQIAYKYWGRTYEKGWKMEL